jgi:hypothetical protein
MEREHFSVEIVYAKSVGIAAYYLDSKLAVCVAWAF